MSDLPAALDTPGKCALYNNLLPPAAPEADHTPVSEDPEAYRHPRRGPGPGTVAR